MIPQHKVMEQTNEGRCPVGGVPPHGSEHVMVLLIPVVEVRVMIGSRAEV